MESFEEVNNNILNFIKNYNFKEISGIDNQSNLQKIFINKDIRLEFIRDRGEFDVYIGFFNIKTKRDIYSIVSLAKILSNKDFSNSNSNEIIKYLYENICYIKESFINNNKQLERDYDNDFKNSFWD